MRLAKFRTANGAVTVGVLEGADLHPLALPASPGPRTLADVLAAADPADLVHKLLDPAATVVPLSAVTLLPPIDQQEVWAAGVTYLRSKTAREEESASAGGASFYDRVYTAPRPELFFKATPRRVVGPGQPIRARADSRWTVPEPELALVVSPDLRIVGYTVGNDVSARDIEGENPLYLPQAKIYAGSCAVGPLVTPASAMPPLKDVKIYLTIRRRGEVAFHGETSPAKMARTPDGLVDWL